MCSQWYEAGLSEVNRFVHELKPVNVQRKCNNDNFWSGSLWGCGGGGADYREDRNFWYADDNSTWDCIKQSWKTSWLNGGFWNNMGGIFKATEATAPVLGNFLKGIGGLFNS